MRSLLLCVVLGLGFVAGCTRVDELTSQPPAQPAPAARGYRVAVMPGETLDDVARRFDVTADALIQANHLQPPYAVMPHQVLVIPPPGTYTVHSGDTVEGIATMLGVDEGEIARANELQRPYQMRIGQVLKIPGGVGGQAGSGAATDSAPIVAAAPRASISSAPLAPPPGAAGGPPSAAGSIAPQPASPAAAPTSMAPPSATPDATRVPSVAPALPKASTASPTALAPPSGAPRIAAVAPPVMAPAPSVALTQPPAPAPPAAAAPSPGSTSPATAAAAGAPHFLTPVKGDIIGRFGPDGSGQKNDGINIAAPAGTSVQAADGGTVIYAGNELPAFGNLVMIRHAGGWVTAYGHLGSIAVQRGASVARGQSVGTIGQTGSVSSPQLHFEIRQGSSPVDPAPYLAGKT